MVERNYFEKVHRKETAKQLSFLKYGKLIK